MSKQFFDSQVRTGDGHIGFPTDQISSSADSFTAEAMMPKSSSAVISVLFIDQT